MSEQSHTEEQVGMDPGEGRRPSPRGEDDVEGHRFTHKRDEGLPGDEGDGLRPRPFSDDDEPDVEGHRFARRG